MKAKTLFALCFVFFLSGCAAKFRVSVNSLVAENGATRKNYLLLPGNGNTEPDDLLFREFSAYMARVLAARGYSPAQNAETADLAIFMSYGIGNPKDYQYSYVFPAWNPALGTERVASYKPSAGIKGYAPYNGSYAGKFRFIFLDAYDLRKSRLAGKPVELWETSITSGGSSDDLRLSFPILLTAARESIGVNTGHSVEYVLDPEDPRILDIKAGKNAVESANWREELRSRLDRKLADGK
jgi:hypothetical protein